MAIYIPQVDGYIADNPNLNFMRCDGEVFDFYEVNTASVSNTSNAQTITGGQGNYPLAFIETDKSLEITFASSQFTLDMFAMANATKIVEGDVGALETKRYEVETAAEGSALVINLPFEVQAKSVKIRGMEEVADAAAAGKFTVAITAATEQADGKTVITFATGDVTEGDVLRVSYRRRVVGAKRVIIRTDSTTAKGEATLDWPVYSSGTDCTESTKKGTLYLYIPRCRVTALPGFDSSYKSAGTNSVTFSAIDPKRPDGKMFEYFFEPLDADGNIVTKSAAESVAWN